MSRVVSRVAATGTVVLALAALVLPASVAAETIYLADLTGDQEVPGPGDPDGAGFAELRIDPAGGQVCAFIVVDAINEPVAAHIHAGAEGVAGGVVVTLPTPVGGEIDDCVDGLDEATLQAIVDDPSGYYVNVHTDDFPDGAIRGQLGGIDVGPVSVVKKVCPAGVTEATVLTDAIKATCQTAVTEAIDPPEGHTWIVEPFVFPELALTISDDLDDLTLADAEPAEGGSTCGPTTCSFGGGGWTWPVIVGGPIVVTQDTLPAGRILGHADVIGVIEGQPPIEAELLSDNAVGFDFDPNAYPDGIFVVLYDVEPSAPVATAAPTAVPIPSVPPTATLDDPGGPIASWPLGIILTVAAGLLIIVGRRLARDA